jgi:hypothetical protein
MKPPPRSPGHARWILPGLILLLILPGALATPSTVEWVFTGILSALTAAGIVSVVKRSRRIALDRQQRAAIAAAQRDHAWRVAAQLRRELPDRQPRNTVKVWDLIPNADEVFITDAPVHYARYYGQDVTYTTSSGVYFGSPLFVVAGLIGTAASNSAARSRAEAMARSQWREHQTVRLVVTNQRLCCRVGNDWYSFYYSHMTAIYPLAEQQTLVCTFGKGAPLMISGPWAPAAAVVTTLMTLGVDPLLTHPGLRCLDGAPGLTR